MEFVLHLGLDYRYQEMQLKKPVVGAKWLGQVSYRYGLEIQQRLVDRLIRQESASSKLLLMESYPVYTVGIRRNKYPLAEKNRLRSVRPTSLVLIT